MKKKIFGSLIVIVIVVAAAFNVNMNTQDSNLSTLALANVEALAQSEGDGKIELEDCIKSSDLNHGSTGKWFIICNSSTTSNTIYSCQTSEQGDKKWLTSSYKCHNN
jgi:hypothetical protein